MRVLLLSFLLVGLASSSGRRPPLPANGGDSKPAQFGDAGGRDVIGDIGKRIQSFLDFLCSRCQEVVTQINKQIDSQSLLEYAEQLCDGAFPNNGLRDMCHNVTKVFLKQVYAFLKGVEPDPQICVHLRLCDGCSPSNSTRREIPLFLDSSSRSFVNSLLVRLAPLAAVFSSDAAPSSQQQPAVDNEIKP